MDMKKLQKVDSALGKLAGLEQVSKDELAREIRAAKNAQTRASLEVALGKLGLTPNETKQAVDEWIEACRKAEEERKRLEEERRRLEEEKRLAQLVPVYQCAVCRRTGLQWAPCSVAPFLLKMVSLEDAKKYR
jgi:single-stranded DNA-specific DHH superfamily exonuclease